MKRREKSRLFLFPTLLLLLFSACASLPKASEIPAEKPPSVVGPGGELSPGKSEAVIKKVEKQAENRTLIQQHLVLMESVSGAPLVTGNKITLLEDAPAAYASMKEAILKAHDHINLEVYLFADDDVGQAFADLLLQKQAEGVQVNIIYDSVGCKAVPVSFFERMREGGILALEFNPINPLKARTGYWVTNRDHRKILVVDGKIGFTGGINVAALRSEGSSGKLFGARVKMPWRDTHVRIEGPAAAELQKLFLDSWTRQKGPDLPPRNYFPPQEKKGDDVVQVLGNIPGEKDPAIYLMYVSAISHAQKSVHLTNPYFAPDEQMTKALKDAARRGVDVKIVLPGSSDIGIIFFAGRSFYTELLESGVKLYERKNVLLHAKTAVVDGAWTTIGSTNLELWSFARNYEVNSVILGEDIASELEAVFEKDLAGSKRVDLKEWEERPVRERMKEWGVRLFRHWL